MTVKTHLELVILYFLILACFTHRCKSLCRFSSSENLRDGEIKGMFVFGSSLVDNGNNNFLDTKSKADYLPYGIDFPNGSSGRFTNGKNVVDLLGEQLKLPSLIPPFMDPATKGSRIVEGVNHASGSAGILDDTGSVAGNATSMNQQIKNFEEVTLPDLEAQLGCKSSESLPNYIFVIGIGGNDYVFNYFLRKTFLTVGLERFTSYLISSLSKQLENLYNLGARKFVLTTTYPIGSSPMVNLNQPNCGPCSQALKVAAAVYNIHLKSLVEDIKLRMPGSNFVVVNTYDIVKDIIDNPTSKGFSDTTNACCEVKSAEQGGTGVSCERGGQVCADRNTHVYFDGLHPSEAVNIQIATKAYASNLGSEVYPINVKQLAEL
ncbi:GDSL esterase/lipase At1g29670-like [Quercus robur]|uniref:GDSL esterase/lipase At1g29670-like n=1 Tax=Quercus robur TaxID=38942 RepID=UPI0021614636|nr:GDSL esterase/lipase At1g29670-like [Quercus robur]